MNEYLDLLEKRRSNYDLGRNVCVANEKINQLISAVVEHSPSSFNSQSAKVMVLYSQEHDRFWDLVLNQLKKIVPSEKFPATQKKISGFKNAHGTILFFDDAQIVKNLQAKYPSYSDNFPIWAQQANGMVQYGIWVGLKTLGLGGSLQHYNEVIQEALYTSFRIDPSWQLIAQMPFGSVESEPAPKQKKSKVG